MTNLRFLEYAWHQINGIEREDRTDAEHQIMNAAALCKRHAITPADAVATVRRALSGIEYNDLTTAERNIWQRLPK